MKKKRLGLLLFAWLWLGASTTGVAQSPDSDGLPGSESARPGYAQQISSALNEASLGNFAEAREHFRRAHLIDPSARTLRGLGMVEFELSHYVESARLLSQSLTSEVKPLSGKLRSETEALLERAQEYVGSVQIVSDPKTAAVLVDGAVVDLGPSRTLSLRVGEHVFELRAGGRLPIRRTVEVNGGERVRLELTLLPLARAEQDETKGPLASGTRNEQPEVKPLARKWWLWTTLGVVVVAGAATAAILLTQNKSEPREVYLTGNSPAGSTIRTLWVRNQ